MKRRPAKAGLFFLIIDVAVAKYTLLIPTSDELGRPLRVSMAVYAHLAAGNMPIQAATIHPGHPFDSVVAWAEDTPDIDSGMKQLGAYAGEVVNHPSITVTKAGKNHAAWTVRNPKYVPDLGALPSSLDSQVPGMAPDKQNTGLESPDFPPRNPDNSYNGNPNPSSGLLV